MCLEPACCSLPPPCPPPCDTGRALWNALPAPALPSWALLMQQWQWSFWNAPSCSLLFKILQRCVCLTQRKTLDPYDADQVPCSVSAHVPCHSPLPNSAPAMPIMMTTNHTSLLLPQSLVLAVRVSLGAPRSRCQHEIIQTRNVSRGNMGEENRRWRRQAWGGPLTTMPVWHLCGRGDAERIAQEGFRLRCHPKDVSGRPVGCLWDTVACQGCPHLMG